MTDETTHDPTLGPRVRDVAKPPSPPDDAEQFPVTSAIAQAVWHGDMQTDIDPDYKGPVEKGQIADPDAYARAVAEGHVGERIVDPDEEPVVEHGTFNGMPVVTNEVAHLLWEQRQARKLGQVRQSDVDYIARVGPTLTNTQDVEDTGYTADRWVFDQEIARVFNSMLERSVPDYTTMRDIVFRLGSHFVQPGTDILDLGASRGEATAPFIHRFGAHNRFVCVETAPPMLDALRQRFARLLEPGVVEVRDMDLRKDYPPVRASLTLSILTLMFIPLEHRTRVARRMFEHTLPGGAALIVEKCIGARPETADLFIEEYHTLKRDNGYSSDEVDRKALALEGVLMPVTPAWNEDLLRAAGFQTVEMVWRWLNFCGWLAVRAR